MTRITGTAAAVLDRPQFERFEVQQTGHDKTPACRMRELPERLASAFLSSPTMGIAASA
jgi:hypothetical protein